MNGADPRTGRPDIDPTTAKREELEQLVDDMEKRVEDEREKKGVPGNAAERAKQEPIVPDDQAPD
ncbi:hypothetical protein ACFYVR_16915 [Rhodococcus sp. NPDC003318]|uniref:hypothetical protein n=1 Tax=Rhodococcus sp. NPDC003318 TaxID=3364503 RepID=UPI0036A7463E